MIKVCIYQNSWDDEPSIVLTLKEFEERFNNRYEEDYLDYVNIRFIVV